MSALAAPEPDGIVARCGQEAASTLIPVLRQLFQQMLEKGIHPTAGRVAWVIPVPKPGVEPHLAKGYRPIALLAYSGKSLMAL